MDLLKSIHKISNYSFSLKSKKSPVMRGARSASVNIAETHSVIYWSGKRDKALKKLLSEALLAEELARIDESAQQKLRGGPNAIWLLVGEVKTFGAARDLCGSFLRANKLSGQVNVQFYNSQEEEIKGALVGFGLARYKFLDLVKGESSKSEFSFTVQKKPIRENIVNEANAIIESMNLARHLTNMPAASSTPEVLAAELRDFFKNRKNLKVKIFNVSDLEKEKMGLLLGVGRGSTDGSRLVHLSYRPKTKKNKSPIAFVGKGVTFDTGGLDIKPSSGMRLMKKDMAGAAAVAGVCHFVTSMQLGVSCDFYLPLAENAISDRATRPGDVHVARSGHLVEIDNTDAEGRLVMSDAIDYAVSRTGHDKPCALIDVSTLTGAMRVALGLDIAGYFSNHDGWAKKVDRAASEIGEVAWRMPLHQKYGKELNSTFADFKNSSSSGYGGAITAALFLQKFVRDVPWVHFDVMSWNLSADGALSEGANAQCVQIITQLLSGE